MEPYVADEKARFDFSTEERQKQRIFCGLRKNIHLPT
jgi:hypothetical protein